MDGERAATVRLRQEGKICAECRIPLVPNPDHEYGERLCPRCTDKRIPKRRVFMYYNHIRGYWHCRFVEADLKTPVPRRLTFLSEEKLFVLAQRGRALNDTTDRQALEHGIASGHGAINLSLTAEQYAELIRLKR